MERMIVKGVERISPAIPALPAGDARQEAFERALQTQVGKSLPVAVLARLADGSFLVKVADQHARMALPAGTQPGTELPMTLVSTHPRPAFQQAGAGQLIHAAVVQHDQSGLRTASAGALAAFQAQLAPGAAHDGADARNAHVSLSDAARTIARILSAGQAHAGQAAPLGATAPLAGPGVPDPARLALALQGALVQSGLFYESHVAEWAEGRRGLSELLREPQMQRIDGAPRGTAADADPAVAQLIGQQLAAHEHGRVAWHGQAWPGQDMHWDIQKDAPGSGKHSGDEAEPGWRSGLRLRFAGLGEIVATVVVAGDQLHIQLKADTDESGTLLRAHSGKLTAALGAAGSPLASLDISSGQGRGDG